MLLTFYISMNPSSNKTHIYKKYWLIPVWGAVIFLCFYVNSILDIYIYSTYKYHDNKTRKTHNLYIIKTLHLYMPMRTPRFPALHILPWNLEAFLSLLLGLAVFQVNIFNIPFRDFERKQVLKEVYLE